MEDTDPKALACYGVLLRRIQEHCDQMLLRFVNGRPVSAVTTDFLTACCKELEAQSITVLVLIWDNASWHKSQIVRGWIRTHNQTVKREGSGVRLLPFLLSTKSPWLNPIEPKWVHSKRNLSEADRLLSTDELETRVCAYYGFRVNLIWSSPKRSLDSALGKRQIWLTVLCLYKVNTVK